MPFEYGDLPLKTTHLRELVPPFCIVNSSSIGILENVGIIPLHSHVSTIRLIQLTLRLAACVLLPQRNRVDPKIAHNVNVRIQVFYCYTCDVGIYLSQVHPQVQQYVELKLLLWVRAFTPICDITGVCGAHAMLQVVFLPRINCTWVSSVVLCSTLAAPSRFLHDSCASLFGSRCLLVGGRFCFSHIRWHQVLNHGRFEDFEGWRLNPAKVGTFRCETRCLEHPRPLGNWKRWSLLPSPWVSIV